MTILLTNAAATGAAVAYPGGKGFLAVVGTFGGASLQLQYLGPDSATWVNVGAAITAAGSVVVEMPPGPVRMAVTGGPPSGLYARIHSLYRG